MSVVHPFPKRPRPRRTGLDRDTAAWIAFAAGILAVILWATASQGPLMLLGGMVRALPTSWAMIGLAAMAAAAIGLDRHTR